MKAEDIIIDELLLKARLLDPYLSADRERYVAEISFTAGMETAERELGLSCKPAFDDGKRAGIKEVVEWINEHKANPQGTTVNPTYMVGIGYEWQIQLEDWGIEL